MQSLLNLLIEHNVSGINIHALSWVPFFNRWGMSTEDDRRAMQHQRPVHAWKTRSWMKRVQQRDWHRSSNSGMHPGFLATERMKCHITCPNKAVMKANKTDYVFYKDVIGECIATYNDSLWKLINHGQGAFPACLYLFIHAKEYSKGIKKAKAKLYMDRWMKWNSRIGNNMQIKIIMDKQLQKK